MIELCNVHIYFTMGDKKYHALNGIDLKIDDGECVALVGASGSGKSTTMHIIGLLDQPSSGKYLLDGVDTATLDDNERAHWRGNNIGFVFQSFFLLNQYSAIDNICLPLHYQDICKSDAIISAEKMLDSAGLLSHKNHKPSELSGGQKQRIAIARALITNPKIILADEPTGALDGNTSQQILDLLLNINKQHNTTLIIVTHDNDVASKCNRTINIKDGVIQ